MKRKINLFKLILAIILCELTGIIGGIFTASSVSTWYPGLIKPWFNPPSWVFAPIWTTLFALMGISLYLLWQTKHNKRALQYFYTQLALNLLWSILFFGMKNPLLALIELILLGVMIALTIISSYKINKAASYLLLPYIAWVSFAFILNVTLVMLN